MKFSTPLCTPPALCTDPWIQTVDKQVYNLADPNPLTISPEAVAHALACSNRYGGHTAEPYTNAQHSCLVLACLMHLDPNRSRELRLATLLHDAHEPYWGFGDPASPVKRLNDAVNVFLINHAAKHQTAFAERFGFEYDTFRCGSIKEADILAMRIEKYYFMNPVPLHWFVDDPMEEDLVKFPHDSEFAKIWNWELARGRFLIVLQSLWSEQDTVAFHINRSRGR